MIILPLHSEIQVYLTEKGLTKKFEKQKNILEANAFHPSLHTELLEPRRMRIWSFRLDKKYRALFIFRKKNVIEIIEINDHYQ